VDELVEHVVVEIIHQDEENPSSHNEDHLTIRQA
jgi:hypothetical protein